MNSLADNKQTLTTREGLFTFQRTQNFNLSDQGKPITVLADMHVEAFGNIKEANMVSKKSCRGINMN